MTAGSSALSALPYHIQFKNTKTATIKTLSWKLQDETSLNGYMAASIYYMLPIIKMQILITVNLEFSHKKN